jgi:hypothetical protein
LENAKQQQVIAARLDAVCEAGFGEKLYADYILGAT